MSVGADYYILHNCETLSGQCGANSKTVIVPPTNLLPLTLDEPMQVVGYIGTQSYPSDIVYLPEPGLIPILLAGIIVLIFLAWWRRRG